MSKKRFELTKINPTVNLSDTVCFIIDYENPNKEIRTLKDCVDLLNTLHQENQELKKKNNALKEDINQSEKRVKHWMMLYEDVYDKMQKRRVSG